MACMHQVEPVPSPAIPGADLVAAGLADLRAGRRSEEAMLVSAAASRLRMLGYVVPHSPTGDPDGELYDLIRLRVGDARAHGTYNALRRRIVSFLRSSPHAATG